MSYVNKSCIVIFHEIQVQPHSKNIYLKFNIFILTFLGRKIKTWCYKFIKEIFITM